MPTMTQDLPPDSRTARALRVLVVDDNEALATTLLWLIEGTGDEVEMCHSGPAALSLVQTFRPDVVLLDIGMPVMDGLQVCAALRADPEQANLKIVAQSGYGDMAMQTRTTEAGFDKHLVKPVDFDELLELLASFRQGLDRQQG